MHLVLGEKKTTWEIVRFLNIGDNVYLFAYIKVWKEEKILTYLEIW